MSVNFVGYCVDCINFDKEVSFLKKIIEQLEKEKEDLYNRCLENDAIIKGNDNKCCEYCVYHETSECPIKKASPWSRWGNYCNKYKKI